MRCTIRSNFASWGIANPWTICTHHRRRMHTEENAKVVHASLGIEFLQNLAALTILNLVELKNMLICILHPIQLVLRQISLFFKSSWCKIASTSRNQWNSVPQEERRPLPSLLYKTFFYYVHDIVQWSVHSTHTRFM